MDAAIGATLAAIGKKLLVALAGDKNGRKFLGYVIGIALVIVLLPVIAVYGLFGWMAGGGEVEGFVPSSANSIYAYESQLTAIEETFRSYDLSERDIEAGQVIYLSCLVGRESEERFYQTYADCFLNRSEEADLLSNISSAFGIAFTDADRAEFQNLYGGTP